MKKFIMLVALAMIIAFSPGAQAVRITFDEATMVAWGDLDGQYGTIGQ